MTLQDAFAATLVDEWARNGVTEAVVAPGSRSTPLAVALAADGRLRLHVILDERSAAFFALGLGLASGRPAVLLTTSGTAAAELHAAVVEAHQAKVALIACTADRPPDLHHVGAPQTVEQDNLFAGAVRWAHTPGMAGEADLRSWRSVAARAVAEATANPTGPGPVHLNLAFREPLAGTPDRTVAGRRGGAPWHIRAPAPAPPPANVVAALAGAGAQGVIVAGAGAGDPGALHRLAGALGWPLLADPRSGCRVPGPATVAAADAILRSEDFSSRYRPDVVVRLGAPWASRVVGEWLAGLDVAQYLVDPYGAWLDPGRSATTLVAADPTLFATAVADAGPVPAQADWATRWATAEASAQEAFTTTLATRGLTEPAVARTVVGTLPAGATLFVSSSMPVRDVEWYGAPRTGLRVLSNRGANGIDGVVSSALGAAVATGGHTVLLVGDLAFLHDTNALLIPRGTGNGVDATIVVVDNDGGGIFSFLPQATALSEARFERLLGTPHGLDLCAVARAHGVRADPVTTVDEVAAAVACPPDGVKVVVARTPDRRANAALHDELHRAVTAAVRQ